MFSSINHFTICLMTMTIAFFKRKIHKSKEEATTNSQQQNGRGKENSCVHVDDFSVLCPTRYNLNLDIIILFYIFIRFVCCSLYIYFAFSILFSRFILTKCWADKNTLALWLRPAAINFPEFFENVDLLQNSHQQCVVCGYENWPQ